MKLDTYLIKLQSIAKIGLLYSTDPYALENYEELEQLSKEMIETYYGVNLLRPNYFSRDVYPTPNMSVRTFILNEHNQLLMVKEAVDGKWSVPGGWCDIGDTAATAAYKEVEQETGYQVRIDRLLGLLCYSKNKLNKGTFGYVAGYSATIIGGNCHPCHEISEVQYFDLEALPPISNKMSIEEIERFVDIHLNKKEAAFD